MNGLARVAGGARPLRRLPPWNRHRFAACVAAIAAAWMAMLGARYVALGYADVRGGLGLGVGDGSWLSTAYAVGDVVGVVLGCWLATALSLRRVLLGTTGLFVLASGLLALSPPYAILLAARGAQGLAGGALLPMAIVALLRTLPPGHRALALALYTSASTVAPQLAAGIAGWLLDRWGWQALLLANLLPGLLAWAAGTYGLPREPLRVRPLLHTDRFGLLLLIGGWVCSPARSTRATGSTGCIRPSFGRCSPLAWSQFAGSPITRPACGVTGYSTSSCCRGATSCWVLAV